MRRDEALAIIRAHEAELRAMGVESIELFGSVARDEAGPGSDVDVLVRFDDAILRSGWNYASSFVRVRDHLARMLDTSVDVAAFPLQSERLAAELRNETIAAY